MDGNSDYYQKRVPQGLFAILGEVSSLEEELTQLDRVHQDTLRAVQAFPLECWDDLRENQLLNIRRKVAVMLFGINDHHVHHRAQVGTYLRILTGRRASPYPV